LGKLAAPREFPSISCSSDLLADYFERRSLSRESKESSSSIREDVPQKARMIANHGKDEEDRPCPKHEKHIPLQFLLCHETLSISKRTAELETLPPEWERLRQQS
jgi:hypothetical protein